MRRPEENPPRRRGETAHYEEEPFDLGEIDDAQLEAVEDFLPRPEELAFRQQTRK